MELNLVTTNQKIPIMIIHMVRSTLNIIKTKKIHLTKKEDAKYSEDKKTLIKHLMMLHF